VTGGSGRPPQSSGLLARVLSCRDPARVLCVRSASSRANAIGVGHAQGKRASTASASRLLRGAASICLRQEVNVVGLFRRNVTHGVERPARAPVVPAQAFNAGECGRVAYHRSGDPPFARAEAQVEQQPARNDAGLAWALGFASSRRFRESLFDACRRFENFHIFRCYADPRCDFRWRPTALASRVTAGGIISREYPLNPMTKADRGGAAAYNLLIARTMTP
jgi:hypothetical protein